jgi:hypothetical protein
LTESKHAVTFVSSDDHSSDSLSQIRSTKRSRKAWARMDHRGSSFLAAFPSENYEEGYAVCNMGAIIAR